MKTRFLTLAAIAAVSLLSCTKEKENEGSGSGAQIYLEASTTEIAKTATIKLSLTEPVSSTVVVTLAAVEGEGYLGADHLEFTPTVSIAPGTTVKSFAITVRPVSPGKGALAPGTYNAAIKIASVNGADPMPGADQVSLRYVRKDVKPEVSLDYDEEFDDAFVDNACKFKVVLTEEAAENVTVKLSLADQPTGASNAVLGRDAFTSFPESVTIAAGTTDYTVTVVLNPEKLAPNKKNEAVIRVSEPSSNAVLAATNTSLSLFADGPIKVTNMEGTWKAEYIGRTYNDSGTLVYGIETTGMAATDYYLARYYLQDDDPITDDVIKNLTAYWVKYYADYPDATVDDYCYKGEDVLSFSISNGANKYQLILLGFEADGTPNYNYLVYNFEIKDDTVKASYDDFLGNWVSGNTLYTVTKKEEGKSYYIDGIDGADKIFGEKVVPTALFEDGQMVLMEQKLGEFEFDPAHGFQNNYGWCDDYLVGIFVLSSGDYSGYFPAWSTGSDAIPEMGELKPLAYFTKLEDGTIQVVGGGLSLDEDTYFEYDAIGYAWIIRNGSSAGGGNWEGYGAQTPLPMLMESAQEATPEYNRWIGEYKINAKEYQYDENDKYIEGGDKDVEHTLSITVGRPNETFNVSGFGAVSDYYGKTVLSFNPETGGIALYAQELMTWIYVDDEDENAEEIEITEMVLGYYNYIVQDSDVSEDGYDPEDVGKEVHRLTTGKIFSAEYDEEGVIALVPSQMEPEEGEPFDLDGFMRLRSIGDEGIFSVGNKYELPNTLTRIVEEPDQQPTASRARKHGPKQYIRKRSVSASARRGSVPNLKKVEARDHFSKVVK